jgi:AcrR family transcriptional regulator
VTTKRSTDTTRPATNLRGRLIDEAIGLLEREGLEALTLRGIARAAGVSHMAPYRHFADKDTLLAAVAEAGFRELSASMDRSAAAATTARARLRAIGMTYVHFARRRPALYRLMFGPLIADKERFPELAEASRATFTHCASAVTERIAPADGANEDAQEVLTLATWSLAHGLSSLLIDGRLGKQLDTEDEDRLIGQIMALFGRTFQDPAQT